MESDGNEKKDIINFYNEIFIKVMKEYIITTKNPNEHAGSRTPIINAQGQLTPHLNKA